MKLRAGFLKDETDQSLARVRKQKRKHNILCLLFVYGEGSDLSGSDQNVFFLDLSGDHIDGYICRNILFQFTHCTVYSIAVEFLLFLVLFLILMDFTIYKLYLNKVP